MVVRPPGLSVVMVETASQRAPLPSTLDEMLAQLRERFLHLKNTPETREQVHLWVSDVIRRQMREGDAEPLQWHIDVELDQDKINVEVVPEVLRGRRTLHVENKDGTHTFVDELTGVETTRHTFFAAWTRHACRVAENLARGAS